MKKKRIGVVIDSVNGIYQSGIVESIIEQTENQYVDLFFICGLGVQNIPGEYEVQQGALRLANSYFFDGLILVLSSFTNYFSKEWIDQLVDSYDTEVKITIGYASKNCERVAFDNVASIEKVMVHLIEELNCKKIGYISGPLDHEDANARYEGYKMLLNDYSIEIDKQFYYEDYFVTDTGIKAIQEMIKKSYEIPEAIVCASDEIAIGAIFELLRNDIAVPYKVKVTGFDNITASAAFEVPITTIDQPLSEMVKRALVYLEQVFYGKESVIMEPLTGELIKRKSTKDFVEEETIKLESLREASFIDENIVGSHIQFENDISANLDRLKEDFFMDFEVSAYGDKIFNKMIKALVTDVKGADSKGMFMSQVKELATILVDKMPYSLFNHRFSEFNIYVSELIFNSQLYYRVQKVMFNTALSINNHFYSLESDIKQKTKNSYIMTRSFVDLSDKAQTLDEYLELLTENIKIHVFEDFYLCLFEETVYGNDSEQINLPDEATMVIGMNKETIYSPEKFETLNILPDKVYRDYKTMHLVLQDIVRDNIHYGYILMKTDPTKTLHFETLRLSISQGIHRFKSI